MFWTKTIIFTVFYNECLVYNIREMWFMKWFILGMLICTCVLQAFGKTEVYRDSLDVSKHMTPAEDTIWFVNYKFDEKNADKVDFELKFTNYSGVSITNSSVSWKRINPVDGTDEGAYGNLVSFTTFENILEFEGIEKGLYFLEFTFNVSGGAAPQKAYGYFFNKKIEFDIVTVKCNEGSCLKDEQPDTCIFTLENHLFNPKGTKYEMRGNLADDEILIDEAKPEGVEDVFYVIFKGPTGYNDLFLNVTGSYKNTRNNRTVYSVKQMISPIRKYAPPQLYRVFNYDTLALEELKGCTEVPIQGLAYNEDMGKKYMDFMMLPDFKSKEGFELAYYKKEKPEQADWEKIPEAEKAKFVNDSLNFTFLLPGIYRVWMVDSNFCGSDTLDTEIWGDGTLARPIRIYRNDVKELKFKQDVLCLSGDSHTDTLVVKDYAYRLGWEDEPEYSLSVYQKLKDVDGNDSLALIKENMEEYYEALAPHFAYDEDKEQYDSTTIKYIFRQKGHYRLILAKSSSECSVVTDSLELKVAEAPKLKKDFLNDSDAGGIPLNAFGFCGEYIYKIPAEIAADSNWAFIDKYEWKFGKGSAVETYTEKLPTTGVTEIVFDSLGEKASYITLRVGNSCGWSTTDSVSFYTFETPKVELWRDSVPNNDTLCSGRDYKYHFKGFFPKNFEISPASSGHEQDSVQPVWYPDEGKVSETYTIINTDRSECKQVISGEVMILAPPLFTPLNTTVDFCESTTEIQTHALVDHDFINFKNLKWHLTDPEGGALTEGSDFPDGFPEEMKSYFPKFTVTQEEMTLEYLVSSDGNITGKGCFDRGVINFKRYPAPQLILDHDHSWKLCETKDFSVSGLLKSAKEDALNLNISIDGEKHFSSADGNWNIDDYTCPEDKDSVKIVFEASQQHNYTGQKGCDLRDSVTLYITHPHITFLKTDTVYDTNLVYDFKRMRNYTDTADVTGLTWEVATGLSSIHAGSDATDIFDNTYNCNLDTPGDLLYFRLRGTSSCGDIVTGLLGVYYPVTEIKGGTAYLCDDIKEYALWSDTGEPGHATGFFIDKNTLEWDMVSGSEFGSIDGEHGDAKLKLNEDAGGGRIVIEFKARPALGATDYLPTEQLVIEIHKRPRMTFIKDFPDGIILTQGDSLLFSQVVTLENYGTTDWSSIGNRPVESDYYLPDYSGYNKFGDTLFLSMSVEPGSQKGCGQLVQDTLPLIVYPGPKVSIDKDTLKICAGEEIKIGEAANGIVSTNCGYDVCTADWSTKSGCADCLTDKTATTVEFHSPGPGFETIVFTATTQNAITNYQGKTNKLTGNDNIVVRSHGKPDFNISRRRDTICQGATTVDISGISVSTAANERISYVPKDMNKITDHLYDFPLGAQDSAKIYIYAEQEGCTKWSNERDSITIIRLPELEATLLKSKDYVCSNKTLDIAVANTNTHRFTWAATEGGGMSNMNFLTAEYIPAEGVLKDTVVFTALPMLAECPGSKVAKQAIEVVIFPDLSLNNDTICSATKEYQLKFEGNELIESISWSSATGGAFKHGANQINNPVYLVDAADVNAGEVKLTAAVTLKSPCDGVSNVEISMLLKILRTPELTIAGSDHQVCQEDSISLSFVSFSPGVTNWEWTAEYGHFNNPESEHPYYFPEDNSGFLPVTVTFMGEKTGSHTCMAETQVNLTGLSAEQPAITIPDMACQQTAVVCKTNTEAAGYKWLTSEGIENFDKEAVLEFTDPGKKWVNLEVTYQNGCKRLASDTLVVNPKAEAEFKADSTIVGVNREIHFINKTENFQKQWWFVNDDNVSDSKDLAYTFSASGTYQVDLVVENSFGCKDTVSEEIEVLVKPIAQFAVTLEDPAKPCDGSKAIFQNLTTGDKAYYSYKWILGTETTGIDTTTEVPTGDVIYRASQFHDTIYYVTLIVENAAGADTATYQKVKIVSPIKAGLVPEDKETKCAGFDRAFFNNTSGTADWYQIKWGDGCDTTFTDISKRLIRHKYTNSTYEVREDTVRISAGNVCSEDSMKFAIKIYPNSATAKIQVDQIEGCYEFEAKLHNVSIGFGGVHHAIWDFGEGDPAVEDKRVDINHVYKKPGEYKVRLTVNDECNTSKDSVVIKVKGNDKLAFLIKEEVQCSSKPITFEVDPEIKDQFYDYQWNFDYSETPNNWDPATQNQTTVTKKWTDPGTNQIALKAKSLDGCDVYAPARKTIEIKKSPIADFQFRRSETDSYVGRSEDIKDCSPLDIEFKNVGAADTDLVFWDFADGGTSSDKVAKHTFINSGTQEMMMKVTTVDGCVDSVLKAVTVKPSPEASFRNKAGNRFCAGGPVHLDIENLGANQDKTTYVWSYRNPGETDFVQWDDKAVPQEKFLDDLEGEIVLKLKATYTESGCELEKTDTIIASSVSIDDFKIEKEKVCDGEEVNFRVKMNQGEEVTWNLGDASAPVRSGNFTYRYGEPGKYKVTLQVANQYGCEEKDSSTIYVYPVPKADFSYEDDYSIFEVSELPEGIDPGQLPKIKNGSIHFTNHSSIDSYEFSNGNLQYEWNFGDASNIILATDPDHHFANNGLYEVKLLVKTDQGCVDSLSETITIDAVKGLFIPNAFAPGAGVEENPGVALFRPKGIGLLSYKIKVYDESGTCVWISDKLEDGRPAEAWDGTFNGTPLPKGLYTWEVNAIFIDGAVWAGEGGHTKGYVIIIR